ncbi:MAG TPA: hypothetical protein VGK94_08300 [Candidatus Polarisedimenticolia bacterium]|jgi:tRNA nucleotidyltransferase (CCA-adding enzyme)
MEPLRVAVGATESVAEAARRLRIHRAAGAPVVRRGRPVGLVTGPQTQNAIRHGAAAIRVADLVCGGSPRVDPGAGPRSMWRAARGIAPGLLVSRARGTLLGFITRESLDGILNRPAGSGPQAARPAGRSLRGAIESAGDGWRATFLGKAAALARARGVGLFLVGGVVRDLLLGRSAGDLDLVVEGDGIAFAADLARLVNGRVIRHATFGTASVILDEEAPAPGGAATRIDVATARRETYAVPASLPRVEPGTLLDDLLRRDVTINAMAVRLENGGGARLVDELGGERDLRLRTLRIHHLLSIVEDPTRALRIARFAARFGFTPSDETLSGLALALRLGAFEALGGERLRRELGLIAREPEPAAALAWCAKLGLLPHLGSGLSWNARVRRAVARLHAGFRSGLLEAAERPASALLPTLMLLALEARAPQREALAARLRITGSAAVLLRTSAQALADLLRGLAGATRPSRIVRLCEAVPPEILAIAWAAGPPRAAREVRLYLESLRHVRSSVDGRTLRAMGLPPGPLYASILSKLRWAALDGGALGEEEQRRLAQRLVRQASRR